MHRYKVLIFGLFTLSAFAQNSIFENDSSCIIKPFIGINKIVLGKTNVRTVKRSLPGKSSKTTRWEKNYESFLLLGNFVTTITNADSTVIFKFYRDKRFFDKKKVQEIIIQNCSCKTKEGIGIGSSYNEIVNVLGEPFFFGVESSGPYKSKTILLYFAKYGQTKSLRFESEGAKNKNEFMVQKIIM